jgi:hypothetical protein
MCRWLTVMRVAVQYDPPERCQPQARPAVVGSLDPDSDGLWRSPLPRAADRRYRLCTNYTDHQICNWAVNADDPHPLCLSRRLVFTLARLRLPLLNRDEDPEGGRNSRAMSVIDAQSVHSS